VIVTVLAVPQVRVAARWIPCSRGASIEMQVTGMAGAAGLRRHPMHGPTDNATPPRLVLMRLPVRSWEYRHPRTWVGVRFACAAFNLGLGLFILAYGYWPLAALAAIPLASSALIFWTGYRLQHALPS
jgi:hypothetical protein